MNKIVPTILIFILLINFAFGAEYTATPANYQSFLKKLKPGDTLTFSEGEYKGNLQLDDIHGEEEAMIVLQGIEGKTIFMATADENTINFINCSYIHLKNFKLNGNHLKVDGIKMKQGGYCHHLIIENNTIINYDDNQQQNGISSKGTVWNISIIGNIIEGAGTGLYLGNSDGSAPFIGGLIEKNAVINTIGYNMEIKHQLARNETAEVPALAKTIIRHNVFSKQKKGVGNSSGNRPNVLVGHFPLTGKGKDDEYLIYGNFFYENCMGEALFQGEGNIAFYNNVLVNSQSHGIHIQKHNDKPRNIKVFFNTIVTKTDGLRISSGDAGFKQLAIGNLVFSNTEIGAPENVGNLKFSYEAAKDNLVSPYDEIGTLNLFPQPNKAKGEKLTIENLLKYPDANYDFNGVPRTGLFRGAFEGTGMPYRWLPLLKRMRMDYYNELAGTNKRLSSLVNRIKSGAPLTSVLSELERNAASDTASADILRELINEGKKDLAAADELKETDGSEALTIYDRVIKRFGTHEIGKIAKESATVIRAPVMKERSQKLIKEKIAANYYIKIQQVIDSLTPIKGKIDYEDENFLKQNAKTILNIKKACEYVVKNYGGTSTAIKASEMLIQLTPKEKND
jgi:hypothetical protein